MDTKYSLYRKLTKNVIYKGDVNNQDLCFSDDFTFHFNGIVDKHNVCFWCDTNPYFY